MGLLPWSACIPHFLFVSATYTLELMGMLQTFLGTFPGFFDFSALRASLFFLCWWMAALRAAIHQLDLERDALVGMSRRWLG
jgi:hypothetical protein